jgi:uncharacterized damage-inducible protein DinB
MPQTTVASEAADLLDTMAKHRWLLRYTVRNLSDEQAAQHATVSDLCLGGLIKHVAFVEQRWVHFIAQGPSAMDHGGDPAAQWSANFQMMAGETLASLLQEYEQVAVRSAAFVVSLPDLDATQPLPPSPWFEPGARWSARRVLLHVIAETAQHAGHADILRESLDGAKSMG